MYFSRLTVSPSADHSHLATLARQDSYGDHRALWGLFDSSRSRRPFLFRRESASGLPTFLVVSEASPVDTSGLWGVETKAYAPVLREDQSLDFVLRANPVVSRRDEDGHQVRHDVVMDARRAGGDERGPLAAVVQSAGEDWLASRSARHGFEVTAVACEGYRRHRLPRRGSKPVQLSTVDYRGRLRVTDPALLLAALFEGLGHGKAFGCGLLLVKPAR